jgi:hypothetical protein
MKRCKLISCWTNYPIEELGDEPYKQAPVRQVLVWQYDGNKYVTVQVKNNPEVLTSFKSGYLYSDKNLQKRVNWRKISRMINTYEVV